jgi:predicted acylesterase/phospholipase RssA
MARSRKTGSESGNSPARVGIALAGGGPAGAIYEIGALRALDEALPELDFNALHVYVGVSAGAFIASNLANGLSTAQMARAIIKPAPGEHPFVPETFFTPNVHELGRRSLSLPRLLKEALQRYAADPRELSFSESLLRMGRALPVSVFDNEPIRAYLEKIYSIKGRTDDFRKLQRKLVVVAADLDGARAVRFGEPGFDHVPISKAVQASSALPGLYSPVEIDGRYYVDGVLLKTLHASVALEAGADLLLCINPIVPIDTESAVQQGVMKRGKLIDRGLPTVLSQTFRTLIHSRMQVGMSSYDQRYQANILLLEPERDDYTMFFTNIFGFSERRDVCDHAYRSTRRVLLARYDELAPMFAKRGLRLSREVLEDPNRDLWRGVGVAPDPVDPVDVVSRLDLALDRLDALVGS